MRLSLQRVLHRPAARATRRCSSLPLPAAMLNKTGSAIPASPLLLTASVVVLTGCAVGQTTMEKDPADLGSLGEDARPGHQRRASPWLPVQIGRRAFRIPPPQHLPSLPKPQGTT